MAVPRHLLLPLPQGDHDIDLDQVLNLGIVLDLDVISPPHSHLSLSFLNKDPWKCGEGDTLFLFKTIVFVVLEDEKAVALLLAFGDLLFPEDGNRNSNGW